MNAAVPKLAAKGVRRENIAVNKTPQPNNHLAPNFSDRKPPGNCVAMYP